jgi:phosphohistidine phosphatase
MAGGHELYLIRHGVAEQRGEAWPDDAKRPLTARGIARLRRSARGLARAGIGFDVIVTSPLVRARQTAETMAAELDPRPLIVTMEALAPDGSQQAVIAELEKQAKRSRIALVGHEPALGELAAKLAGLRQPLAFKKGAICRIDVGSFPPAQVGALRWLMPPKLLRALKR